MMPIKLRTWWIVVLILFVGGIGWMSFFLPKKKTSRDWGMIGDVMKGELLISITEGGSLGAVKEEVIRCMVNGRRQIIFLVDEGVLVNKGDLLVQLDSTDIEENINKTEIEVANARASYLQAKENLEIRKSLNASQLRDAELKVKFTEMDLRKYKEAEWPLQVMQQESKITLAKDELARSLDRLDWTQQLFQKGYATRSELEADQLSVKRKEMEIKQYEEQLRMMIHYDSPQQLQKLQANVENAREELERVKRRCISELAQAEADLLAKESNLKNREERLQYFRDQLNLCKIYAPQNGLVVYYKDRWSREVVQNGGFASYQQTLITLPDTSSLKVEVKIHESRVSMVKPGMVAYVTLDAFPERRFRGVVTRVAPMPDPTGWWNPDLKVYSTDIVIKDPLPENIKPGLSARAEIMIEKFMDVVYVPIQSVVTINKQQYCYLWENGSVKPVQVKTGPFNDTHVIIQEGLKPGQKILLSPPPSAEAESLGLKVVDSSQIKPEDIQPEKITPTREQEFQRMRERGGARDFPRRSGGPEGGSPRPLRTNE